MLQDIEIKFPMLFKTATYLQNKMGFFKDSIPRLFDEDFDYELGERICKTGFEMSGEEWNQYYKHVDGLANMSLEFLKLQVKLEKTGKYLYSSFKEVEENEYSKNGLEMEGPDYLWGLYFSEAFWKIHHNFVKLFLRDFITITKEKGAVLEIPCGTGFFLCEFLKKHPKWNATGVDLADTAISFSHILFKANEIPQNSYRLLKTNFFEFGEAEKFDRILCGEFLEHLEDPLDALKKFYRLLKNDGRVFITVAVWAAHIDHIFLYNNAEEVRNHIREARFSIEKELVQTVFEKDKSEPEKSKIPVSYAAILSKN